MSLINSILYILKGHDVQKEISELKVQLSDAKNTGCQAVNEKKYAEEESNILKEQLKEAHKDNVALQSQIEEFKKKAEKNKSLHDEINSLNGKLAIKESEIKSLHDENNQYQKDKEKLLKENTELKERCKSQRGKINKVALPIDEQAISFQDGEEKLAKDYLQQNENRQEKEEGLQSDNGKTKETVQTITSKSEEIADSQDVIPINKGKDNVYNKAKAHSNIESKIEKTISLCDGTIEDFPDIVNDTRQNSNRTIRYVFDNNYQTIFAKQFFENSKPEDIAKASRDLSIAYKEHRLLWYCPKCHQAVKIAHWKNSLFFIHAEKNGICDWRNPSQKPLELVSQEVIPVIDNEESGSNDPTTIKYQELKNRIYAALITTKSQQYISDVRIDYPVHDTTDNKKWTRADISFHYKGRLWVIELQHKGQGTSYITEKDKFYCSNNIQTLWIFGSDSDTSYDYLNTFNYKATLFDSHRNAFVFDRQAQQETSALGELRLKCNWLDSNDEWHFKIGRDGINGETIGLDKLTIDDEHCKPYFVDANKGNINDDIIEKKGIDTNGTSKVDVADRENNDVKDIVDDTKDDNFNNEVKEDLRKQDKENHSVQQSHEEERETEAKTFSTNSLWGLKCGDEILIEPFYTEIKPWGQDIYKVKQNNLWGLCNTHNQLVLKCEYSYIGGLNPNGRASVQRTHPFDKSRNVIGTIDENGKPISSLPREQPDGNIAVMQIGLWGLTNSEGEMLIPCQYDSINYFAEGLYQIKVGEQIGVVRVNDGSLFFKNQNGLLSVLKDGKVTVIQGEKLYSNNNDKKDVEEVIKLPNGWLKTKVIGKWGIINKDGKEKVPHRYDEIGDFRGHLIGINSNYIYDLSIYYDYHVFMSGLLIDKGPKGYMIQMGDSICYLRRSACLGKNESEVFGKDKRCHDLVVDDINWETNICYLRLIKPESKDIKLSYLDRDSDFKLNEEVTGKVSFVRKNQRGANKLYVDFSDGRKSVVPKKCFSQIDKNINEYKEGDIITLKKRGFEEDFRQTIWEVI